MNEEKVLTKGDIVEAVQSRMGLSRKTTLGVVDDLLELIKDTLERGESVKISGFGNFETRKKTPRPGRNPRTGQEVTITARRVVTFKPSGVLRKMLNEADG